MKIITTGTHIIHIITLYYIRYYVIILFILIESDEKRLFDNDTLSSVFFNYNFYISNDRWKVFFKEIVIFIEQIIGTF